MKLPAQIPELPGWAWAGIGFAAVWLLLRPKEAGKAVGQGVANTATGLFKGLSEGLFGVPDTDMAKCEAALSANNGKDASLYCPAWKLAAAIPQSLADWLKGLTVQPTRPSAHGGFTGPVATKPASVLTPSILNGGSFETQSDCLLLGVTCGADGRPASGWDLGDWIDGANSQNRTITPVGGLRG